MKSSIKNRLTCVALIVAILALVSTVQACPQVKVVKKKAAVVQTVVAAVAVPVAVPVFIQTYTDILVLVPT